MKIPFLRNTQTLFLTRLILYLLACSLPIFHPSVAVPYDRLGYWLWFGLIPAEILIAYFLSPPRFRFRTWLLAAGGLILAFVLFAARLGSYSLPFILGGGIAFLLTVLVFKTGVFGHRFAILEQLFLAVLYYRLLSFSRASEVIARQSTGITQLILVLIACAFLLHGLVAYLHAFHRGSGRRGRRELVLFLALSIPMVLLVALVLPENFVSHSIVFNRIGPDMKPKPIPLDERGEGWEGGNLQPDRFWEDWRSDLGGDDGSEGREGESGEGETGNKISLEGIPADQWGNPQGGEGGGNKQYAVMVVSSPVDPVYAADAYFGDFDRERGFLLSRDEPLNELAYLRFLETWRDAAVPPDRRRYSYELFYLSTLSERFLAYRPSAIEPTVLKRKYHPFDFSYRAESRISRSGPVDWQSIKGLSLRQQEALDSYLTIDLPEEARRVFEHHLQEAVGEKSGYFERILAILRSFSGFQYEIGFDDEVYVAKLANFLEHTRRGDCTEFSNSAAILARMAGIPARVVTGYLGAKSLQTPIHLQALFMLREVIKPLQDFPLRDLYLITTAHRHSWVQFYMPGYGWVDFESTAYALPPMAGGDPNSMDVVIPLILGEEPREPGFTFPWLALLEVLTGLVLLGLIAAYLYRAVQKLYLFHLSRGKDRRALRALYRLLLIRLSEAGYGLKPRSQTPMEYAACYPELTRFASLYTMLRYRANYAAGEQERAWEELRASFQEAYRNGRRPGLWNGLKRLFSLKGLYYLSP